MWIDAANSVVNDVEREQIKLVRLMTLYACHKINNDLCIAAVRVRVLTECLYIGL